MQFFLILALLIAVALVLFAVQNVTLVTVSFLSFHFEGSLAFILVLVFASGFLSGILMSMPSLFRKASALREQRKRLKKLEEEMMAASPVNQNDNQPLL
jgi:lipopolysaccharide assembly protein A